MMTLASAARLSPDETGWARTRPSRFALLVLSVILGAFVIVRGPLMWRQPGGLDEEFYATPVHSRGSQTGRRPICSIEICWETDWPERHLRTLRHCYGRAPFFRETMAWLEPQLRRRPTLLADLTIGLTIEIARRLGIRHTRFLRSSELPAEGSKTERLLSLLRQVGATHYITGPSASPVPRRGPISMRTCCGDTRFRWSTCDTTIPRIRSSGRPSSRRPRLWI